MSGNESQMRYRHLIVFCKQTKWVQREVETIDVSIKKKKVSTEPLEGEYVIECKYRSLIKVDCNMLGKGSDLILSNLNVKLRRLTPITCKIRGEGPLFSPWFWSPQIWGNEQLRGLKISTYMKKSRSQSNVNRMADGRGSWKALSITDYFLEVISHMRFIRIRMYIRS